MEVTEIGNMEINEMGRQKERKVTKEVDMDRKENKKLTRGRKDE